MYSYISTRPDIGSSLTKVASFCKNPGQAHWKAAKIIIRFLKGTPVEPIIYQGKKGEKVQGKVFSDSDWAQNPTDRKSTSGFIAKIAGAPYSWHSKNQTTQALSVCEAEFVALTEATKEAIWLTLFLGELGIPFATPVTQTDSQSAMELSKNVCYHQRTKHVALKYFFVRDVVTAKTIQLSYVNAKKDQADIMTKLTAFPVFRNLQLKMMGTIGLVKCVLEKGCVRILFPTHLEREGEQETERERAILKRSNASVCWERGCVRILFSTHLEREEEQETDREREISSKYLMRASVGKGGCVRILFSTHREIEGEQQTERKTERPSKDLL
jgi:hypothetical protein